MERHSSESQHSEFLPLFAIWPWADHRYSLALCFLNDKISALGLKENLSLLISEEINEVSKIFCPFLYTRLLSEILP